MRRRKNHTDVSEYQVATKSCGCTDRAREANADGLPFQYRRVQGPVGLTVQGPVGLTVRSPVGLTGA